jgi:hypothetical protein
MSIMTPTLDHASDIFCRCSPPALMGKPAQIDVLVNRTRRLLKRR